MAPPPENCSLLIQGKAGPVLQTHMMGESGEKLNFIIRLGFDSVLGFVVLIKEECACEYFHN